MKAKVKITGILRPEQQNGINYNFSIRDSKEEEFRIIQSMGVSVSWEAEDIRSALDRIKESQFTVLEIVARYGSTDFSPSGKMLFTPYE